MHVAQTAGRTKTAPAGWARAARWRLPVVVLGVGLGLVGGLALLGGVLWWAVNGYLAGDTLTYWLAGTRVNVGHDLYRMRPDDPWLFDMRPHGLFSPPLVVVPWRVLSAMPGTSGMVLWWLSMAFGAAWAASAVLIGTRGWAGIVALAVMPAFTLMVGVGNVDALILAGIVGAWMLRDRPGPLGVLVGLLVSLKLTPAVLVVWLVATRRWRALAWCAAAGLALAVLTAAVLGPAVFLDYLGVMASIGGSRPLSLALLVVGLAAVLVIGRRSPAVAFAVAVVLIPIGSPATAGHTWALALGAAAAWVRR